VAATPPQTARAAVAATPPHPPAGGTAVETTAAAPAGTVTTKPSTATPQPVDVPFDTKDLAPAPGQDVGQQFTIDVGTKDNVRDFSDTRKKIQRALGVSNAVTPWLYEHAEDMVVAGRGKLQRVNVDILKSLLADRIAFIHWSKDKNGMPTTRPSNPPEPVIKAIHADRANLGLPEVDRIAHTPFFGPDGTLQRKPGYHEKARTLYIPTPGINIPDIPDNPTAQQVNEAVELIIDELLGDFPFTGDAERAGAVALGITPFVRTMIDGPTPLFALDAPEPRTGKGLLMEMLLTPSSGRQYTVTPAPTEMREWHKAIVASLRPGPVAAIFDNANARIDSGALASAVTAYPAYTSRLLGFSENADMPLPAVWVVTGNNIVCSTEIAGRVVRIRLDAGKQHPNKRPGERTGFRHPNLRRWVTEHQGDIIAAFLIMVQAWIAAGQPHGTNLPTMGGFEDWVSVVGSILAFHDITGLLTNRESLIDTMTDDATDWSGLIGVMVTEAALAHERAEEAAEKARKAKEGREPAPDDTFEPGVPGDPAPADWGSGNTADPATPGDPAGQQVDEWSASELVKLMHREEVQSPVDFGTTENTTYQARKLGKALRAHRDRRFDQYTLRMRIHGKALWRLEKMA